MLLKDCIEIKNGKDYSDLSKGDIPVYGTGGVFKYVDHYLYDGSALLLPRKGSLNNVMYIEQGKFWTVDTMFYAICKNNEANLKYIYYYLTLFNIAKLDVGSTIPSMTASLYYQIDIPLPNIQTQNKIVEVLSNIDSQINRNNHISKSLQVLAQTTYSRWFNQFEFPDNEGKPYKSNGGKMVWNKVIKKEIPEGWFVKSLCNDGICDFFKGKTPSKVSSEKKENYEKYLTLDSISNTNLQYCEKYNMPVCNGYTIMVMDGAASGDVYVQKYGIVGSTFAMLVPKQTEYNLNNFIYLYLSENKPIYIKTNTGSTIPHANRKFIENMNVLIPNNFELFLNTINPIFEQIHSIDNVNFELVQLKEKLLPLLINGQLNI